MKIGIDARAAAEEKAGRGRVTRELLEAFARLEHEHELVLYCRAPAARLKLDRRFRWRSLRLPDPLWHLWAALAASRECDVFLSTNSYLTVWFTRVPAVMLVFDMITFVPGTSAQRRATWIERATLRRALHRARAVICISATTERDLLTRFSGARGKTEVVPLAASAQLAPSSLPPELDRVRRRYRLDKPFVLFTGTLEPRKNLPRLIEAFATLPPPVRDRHHLVLVGPDGWDMQDTITSAHRWPDLVKRLGYVPDRDLAALYKLCTVFCYPSLYEGFGLPLLEALQAGAPAITSGVSSLPEVGGDGARYVDPHDVSDLRAALGELLSSPGARKALSRRARQQAGKFAWERSARAVLDRMLASVE